MAKSLPFAKNGDESVVERAVVPQELVYYRSQQAQSCPFERPATSVEEMSHDEVIAEKIILVAAKGMLHQRRFACAGLAFDPEHAIVNATVVVVLPLLELASSEQPVACSRLRRVDIVLASMDVAEGKGMETGYHLLAAKDR